MTGRAAAVVLATLAALAAAGGVAAPDAGGPPAQQQGTVVGRPQLALSAPDNRLTSGGQRLSVFVSNAGEVLRGGPAEFVERVTTARNVRLSVEEDRLPQALARGIEVTTGQVVVGTVPQGTSGPFEFSLEVNETLPPGTYRIPFRVRYEYTRAVTYGRGEEPTFADSSASSVVDLTVVVRERPRFAVAVEGAASVPAGDAATVPVTVTNVGTQVATAATVTLRAGNASLFFGDPAAPREVQTAFVRRLAPGESTTVPVTVGATRTTPPGDYPLQTVVRYTDPAGIQRRSEPRPADVAVVRRQAFAVRDVAADVPAEGTGTVRGTVVNTGAAPVENAVVVLDPASTRLAPRETEQAVGRLPPGTAADFSFVVDAPNGTEPGVRLLSARVRYRNPEGEVRTSDPLDLPVAVGPAQTFALRAVAAGLQVGATGTVAGRVVNTGERPVRDAVVVLRPDDPALAPRNPGYAVGTLAPGESAVFSFRVDVGADAAPGPRQVALRVRYRDGRDEARASDPLPASVTVRPEQRFPVRDVAATLQVGRRGTVEGTVVNDGPATARDAVVVLESPAPTLQPREREVAVGTLAPGEAAPFAFAVDVANGTDPGPRQLSARVRYRDGDDERTGDPVALPVVVRPEGTFAVEDLSTTLRVGTAGTVAGRVVNTGETAVQDAVVVVRPTGGDLVARETEYAVGTLAPGEAAPFAFTVDVGERATAGPRSVAFRVRYGPGDDTAVSAPLRRRVSVGPEQTFAVRNVTSTLRVDDSGLVAGTVVNTGPATAENAAVVLQPPGTGLVPRETEYAVGTLAPGETAAFQFRVDATNRSAPGPRPASFLVRYRAGDEVVRSDPIDARVAVAPRADAFDVTPVEATVPVDGRTTLAVRVTNARNATLRDVRARLVATDPFESDDATAFVPSLAPGEAARVRFDLQATGDAVPGTDSVAVRLTYTDAAGDRRTTDPALVAVTVTERGGGPVPLAAAVALAVAVAGAAWWWWRRR